MKRVFSAVTLVATLACTQRRMAYVEPLWGDAPPPIAMEITEVSLERMNCSTPACVYTRTTFMRDGAARRSYRTGKEPDSTFHGRIDSLAFSHLAAGLIQAGLWAHGELEAAKHEEFENQDVLISAATLCRRQVQRLTGKYLNDATVQVVDSAAMGIRWEKCCRAELKGRTSDGTRPS